MKVCFKNSTKYLTEKEMVIVKQFIHMIQNESSLSKDVNISFESNNTNVPMTTGVRLPNHNIHVLAKDRLLVDVLRTIAHEWVHEYQHQKMGLKDNDNIQDIGGPEENMANALAGIFVKKFVKKYPVVEKIIYGTN
jgi:hypothetical protein